MIKTFFHKIALALLVFASATVFFVPVGQAAEITGLYQALVPVKTQQRAERLEVYPLALAQVVIKLSGNRMVPDLPEMEGAIRSARSWVQSYRYDDLPAENYLGLQEEGYQRMLVVEFDDQAITQAMVEAGVPLWGRTRPEVLLWLVVEDRDARYLLAANASAEMESVLERYSTQRGLPLMLPLMDLEDQQRIGYADVWGNFQSSIFDASERYGANAILVGRLYRPFNGQWNARWTLYLEDDAQNWNEEGVAQDEVIGAGIEGAADRVAQRYAQVLMNDVAGNVALTVTNVNSLAGYAKAMKYLESLDVVSRVQVSKVYSDEVMFELEVRGDVKGLEQAIALGRTLRQVAGVQRMIESPQAYVYQLLP